jgi:hypothetical protein
MCAEPTIEQAPNNGDLPADAQAPPIFPEAQLEDTPQNECCQKIIYTKIRVF